MNQKFVLDMKAIRPCGRTGGLKAQDSSWPRDGCVAVIDCCGPVSKTGGNMGQRSELGLESHHDLNEAFQFTYQNLREDKEFVLEAG